MVVRALTALLLVACSKETGPTGDDDDDPSGTCVDDTACELGLEICEDGDCVDGDRDNRFEDAGPLFLGDDQAKSGLIWPPGDIDFYAYESPGGEWISVRTIVEDSDLDTVVTIFASNGAPHCAMDDYPVWPYRVTGFDSVLYAYLPSAGTWYIGVEDQSTAYDLEPAGEAHWAYDVLIREAPGTSESDSLTDPALNADLPDGNTVVMIGILLEAAGDADFVEITHPFDDQLLEVWGQPGLDGSSASPQIVLHDGSDVVADKVGLGEDGYLSWFESRSGTYVLEATDQDGAGGTDAWIPIYFRSYEPGDSHPFFGTNVYEAEAEPNDLAADALPLPADAESGTGKSYTAFRAQGQIERPGDPDWYSADALAGETVSVRCWTERFGSIADLSVTVSQAGVPFGSGSEPDADDVYLSGAVAPAAGPFDVQIVGQGAESGPDSWYRCAVYVEP